MIRRTISPQTEIRLKMVRFRKILEHAREILSIQSDAIEKDRDDYIFDRQYIITLINRIIDQAGMLILNASILVPRQRDELEALSKRLRNETHSILHDIISVDGEEAAIGRHDLPSDALRKVIEWMQFGEAEIEAPLRVLFERVLRATQHELSTLPFQTVSQGALHIETESVHHQVELIDLDASPNKQSLGRIAVENLQCRPLALLMKGLQQQQRAINRLSESLQPVWNWMAIPDRHRVSLHTTDKGIPFHIEASFNGHSPSDFLLVIDPKGILHDTLIDPEHSMPSTSAGSISWLFDVSPQEMEMQLEHLGNRLSHTPIPLRQLASEETDSLNPHPR